MGAGSTSLLLQIWLPLVSKDRVGAHRPMGSNLSLGAVGSAPVIWAWSLDWTSIPTLTLSVAANSSSPGGDVSFTSINPHSMEMSVRWVRARLEQQLSIRALFNLSHSLCLCIYRTLSCCCFYNNPADVCCFLTVCSHHCCHSPCIHTNRWIPIEYDYCNCYSNILLTWPCDQGLFGLWRCSCSY